jgi:hypothetical protein
MADEQVIIDIKVTSEEISEANKKINQLTQSIEELSNQTASARKQNESFKAQQKELTALYNENKISSEKYLSEVDKLNGKILANNKLIAENTVHLNAQKNERNANIKLVDSETGAYSKLSTNLNKLRNAYKDLAVEKKHDTAEGKAMLLQIQQLDAELKQVDETVGQNQRSIGKYDNATKSLRTELRELKQALVTGNLTQEEYNKSLQRAAWIMDEMGDTQARIKGTALDFEGVMGNVSKVTQGAASAFEAAQGAAMLFGDESEDLQKAMLKIQASIALANGLQGLDGFGKALKNLGTQIMSFGPIQKTATTIQLLWNKAINANPLVAAISLIVALAGAVYGLTKIFEDDTEAMKRQNTASDGLVFSSKELKDAHEAELEGISELKDQYDVLTGKMSEFEIKIKQITKTYISEVSKLQEETQKKLDDVGGFWSDFWARNFGGVTQNDNGEWVTAVEEKHQKEKQKIIAESDQLIKDKAIKKYYAEKLVREEQAKEEADEAKKIEDDKQRKIDENNKKAIEKRKKEQEDLEEKTKVIEEENKKIAESYGKLSESIGDAMGLQFEDEKERIQRQNDEKMELLKQYLSDANEATIEAAVEKSEREKEIEDLKISTIRRNRKFLAGFGTNETG